MPAGVRGVREYTEAAVGRRRCKRQSQLVRRKGDGIDARRVGTAGVHLLHSSVENLNAFVMSACGGTSAKATALTLAMCALLACTCCTAVSKVRSGNWKGSRYVLREQCDCACQTPTDTSISSQPQVHSSDLGPGALGALLPDNYTVAKQRRGQQIAAREAELINASVWFH